MNLRRLVQGPINAVNQNQLIIWQASTGSTNDSATGISTPTYAAAKSIWAQIQPVPTDELKHLDQLNIQGVLRRVYLYNAVASAVREDGTGGDLLQFPEIPGGAERTWLVMVVNEQWAADWCSVTVRLQPDQSG